MRNVLFCMCLLEMSCLKQLKSDLRCEVVPINKKLEIETILAFCNKDE